MKEMVVVSNPGWQSAKTVWVAAGGTAGHLLPALGVAEALVRSGVARESIGFIGSTRPLEAQILAPYGFELMQLDVSGLVRKVSLANLTGLWRFLLATYVLFRLARKTGPRVVVGFGGYFSFPPIVAAMLSGIPTVVVETNAVAGLANRLSAKLATKVLASSPSSGIRNAEVIGVPLRPEISRLNRGQSDGDSFRSARGIGQDSLLICVFGGSLGSFTINAAVIDLVESWQAGQDREVVIYHVIGSRDFPRFKDVAEQLSRLESPVRYLFSEFDPEIFKAIAACDLVISRAGSGTVAELGYFEKPSILIPLPNAPGDHQNENAKMLERLGAARVIPDNELNGERLAKEMEDLLRDREFLRQMSSRSGAGFQGDGAPKVSDEILILMRRQGWE